MADQNLQTLNDPTISLNNKFKLLKDFILAIGKIDDSNKETVKNKIKGTPLVRLTGMMLGNEKWLNSVEAIVVGIVTNFLADIKKVLDDEFIEIKKPLHIEVGELSSSQINKVISQKYTSLSRPKTWFNVGNIEQWPLLLIKDTGLKRKENKTIPEMLRDEIKDFLNNFDGETGAIVEYGLGLECLKIKCESVHGRSILMNTLKDKFPKWEINIPSLYNPRVKISNVELNIKDKETVKNWLNRLMTRNKWNDSCGIVSLCHAFKKNDNENDFTYDIVLTISPAIREKIEKNFGYVNTGHKLSSVIDYFDIRQCNKCCSFGHFASKCILSSVCGFCSMSHEGLCIAEKDSIRQKCPNCKRNGENAWSHTCAVFRDRLTRQLEKVNFSYNWIMA